MCKVKLLLAMIVAFACVGQRCRAQETLAAPQLELLGPAGQTVIYSVRYFNDLVAAETIHSRVELPADGSPLALQSLEFGYDGLRLQIAVGTKQPFTARLLDDDKAIKQQVSHATGLIDVRYGNVPENDNLTMPRALLNSAETEFIERFIDSIRSGNAEGLVSPLPLANIDWQTLSSYFTVLTRELGSPFETKEQLDGWIGWEGSLGARVLSGTVRFTKGSCQFKLMYIEGQVVDVVPRAPGLPEDWMDQPPASLDAYVAQAHALTRALLAGNAVGGQLLFSQRYHDEVTVEVLVELSKQLRAMVHDREPVLEFQRSEFAHAADDSNDKRLRIHSIIKSNSGQRCLGYVDFVFPSGADVIGRGHLSSIYVNEAWDSSEPELSLGLSEMLDLVGTADPMLAADKWSEQMQPELKAHIQRSELAKFIETLGKALGTKSTAIDFDLWDASNGQYSTAYGPVKFALAPTTMVQSHWSGEHWVGFTFVTSNFAASTLDLMPQYQAAKELGVRFWTHLLSGEIAAAHALLADRFRESFSVQELTELSEEAEFAKLAKLRQVTFDRVRILERDDRSLSTMFAAFFIAEFEDGTYFPISCELTNDSQDSKFSIVNFSTDVVQSFPIHADELQQRFWSAFASGDQEAIGRLVSDSTRERIQPAVLSAFLSELQRLLKNDAIAADTPPTRMLRHYASGDQLLELQSKVLGPEGSVQVTANFERGTLRSFQFDHPALGDFVNRISDPTLFDSLAKEFVTHWLSEENLRPENEARLAHYLATEQKSAEAMGRLSELHRRILLEAGALVDAEVVRRQPLSGSNQMDIEMRVQLARGTRTLMLTYQVNALEGVISAVEVSVRSE